MARELAGEIPLRVESIYGSDTRKPWVKLTVGKQDVLLPPIQARMLAAWISEAAEAALQDAFLVEWMHTTFELEIPQAGMILGEYRAWRKTHLEQ